ncbi:unnamed protein product [Schistosoma margrebowiei]|uniref:Uncharacterized protein n=1 Tax=Schistosoma margrebowiei TaxID=48269 RepID=A0AA84ZK87_9TREM|nr:unnamed protein product [Schistosoma margrebowiei]
MVYLIILNRTVEMKIFAVFGIVLTYFCAVTFGAESLHRCNKDFEATMEFCFKQNIAYSNRFPNLKSLRNACMGDRYCKPRAKNCLLSALQGSAFSKCPLQRTYIKSINRMF